MKMEEGKIYCFVPGCSNQMTKFAFFTFHRVPESRALREELLEVLHLPAMTLMDQHSVMCSAHFSPMMDHSDLVFELLDSMISTKPPPAASSMVPKCAAVGCCVNLYSRISLFKFPPEGRRFDLWRMIAGCPKKSDCLLLCARHFKRNSFRDCDMRALKIGAHPVYPTRPLNPTYNNYCPLRPPAPPPVSSIPGSTTGDTKSRIKTESLKKWRCGAVGCDVTSDSHPCMRRISFPSDPERLSLWREIVGYVPTTKYTNYLCTRHFGLNQFYDGELRRNFVKMSNPMYPTGPLNLNTMDYCPPELDLTLNMEQWSSLDDRSDIEELSITEEGRTEPLAEDDDSRTEVIIVSEDNHRCSADGCPVTSITHPNVKLYNFPKKNHANFDLWMKMVTCPINGPLSLCARHFDGNQRDRIPKYPFWDLDPETETYKPVFNPLDPKCCVPYCEVTLDGGGVTFHRFPLYHGAFKTWVERIGWNKLDLYDQGDVFRGFRVCSKHFIDDCFRVNENDELVLAEDAVPTMFLGGDRVEDDDSFDDPTSGIEVEFQEVNDTSSDDIDEIEMDRDEVTSRKRRWTEVFFVADNQKRRAKAPVEDQSLLDLSSFHTNDPVNELSREENDPTKSLGQLEESENGDLISEEPVNRIADRRLADFIESTARVCGFSSSQILRLQRVRGKRRRALSALRDALVNNLNEVVDVMGLEFVQDCLTFRKKLLPGTAEPVNSTNSFAACLSLLSAQCFTAYSKVIDLPTLSEVYQGMQRIDGSPGFNSLAWMNLEDKAFRSDSFVVSLNVLEVPLKKQVDFDGSKLIGYVDLGCGIANNLIEATTAIVFFANSVTHYFQVPLGYCLVDGLSPRLRANLIRQYLVLLSVVFSRFQRCRCLSVVCENLSTTYETFQELGVEMDELQTGHFDHPTSKEKVLCFVDNDSALRSMKNLILLNGCLLSKDSSFVVKRSDLYEIDYEANSNSHTLDTSQMPSTLRALHAKLRKDVNPFRKESAAVLAFLGQKEKESDGFPLSLIPERYEETVEFFMVMESISEFFNSQNLFCKESPAVHHKNVKTTLRRIRHCGIYLDTLRDSKGVKLCRGSKRHLIAGLELNLVSLAGYLKQVFSCSKGKQPKMVKSRSLTLGGDRQLLEDVRTPLELRERVELMNKRRVGVTHRPLLHFTHNCGRRDLVPSWPTSSLAHATSAGRLLERYDDFITQDVLQKWAEAAQCPECAAIAVQEMSSRTVGTSFTRSARQLFRRAESALRLLRVRPDMEYPRFVVTVLDDLDFDGFLIHDHLFNSVEFGAVTHFATLVEELLRIYLSFRAESVPTSRKVMADTEARNKTVRTRFARSSWL